MDGRRLQPTALKPAVQTDSAPATSKHPTTDGALACVLAIVMFL